MGRGRAPCCENVGLKKGPWTPAEDAKLIAYIQKYGHENWRALPKRAGLLRCGKSCRLRWINYLRPGIKRGNFSKEEEETIIRLHRLMGNKWSKIASCLPGRTDNEIKNVWNTHLKKRLAPKESKSDPLTDKTKYSPSSPSNSNNISCDIIDGDIKINQLDSKQPNFGSSESLEENNSFDMECSQYSLNTMSEIFMELDQCMLIEGFDLSADDCRDSSSISSLESPITSCDFQEKSVHQPLLDHGRNNQDYLNQVPEIPIDAEIWSMTDDDFCFLTPEVGPGVEGGAHNHTRLTCEGDSTRGVDDKGWLAYLEKELDLGRTVDVNAVEQLEPWEYHGGLSE